MTVWIVFDRGGALREFSAVMNVNPLMPVGMRALKVAPVAKRARVLSIAAAPVLWAIKGGPRRTS